jgi:hypothetical protein
MCKSGKFFSVLAAATALAAQTTPRKPILGTVTEFRMASLEIGIKPDNGAATFFKIAPETEVVQVAPGERDLSKAKPVRVTDLSLTDRVLVSFAGGMTEARRIVLISATDIEKRNEAERVDWQKRGISGTVTAKNGDEITLQMRTLQGPPAIAVAITPKTTIRRYAPDSVKFADAEWSSAAEIGMGDQVRTRGQKSEDGTKLTAEDIVFGTFLTRIGTITTMDREAGKITIDDLVTKKPVTIRVTADTQLKALPDFRWMLPKAGSGGGSHGSPQAAAPAVMDPRKLDVMKLLESLPAAKFESLKVGGAVMVSSTRGLKSDEVTAIRIVSNADFLIETAQAQAAGHEGMSAVDVISRMHGGAMGGAGGLSLPAMLP